MISFQRKKSKSNAHVGSQFENDARLFFETKGLNLSSKHRIPVGVEKLTKPREFDLGSEEPPCIVECKSHTWTESGNIPSAKLTVWNEAMYYFHMAPRQYRKIFFVLKDFTSKRNESLAGYYLRNYSHMVPSGVEFWEYDPLTKKAEKIL